MNDQVREFRIIQLFRERRPLHNGTIRIPHNKHKHAYIHIFIETNYSQRDV